jgi:hypothetical protein
VHSYGSIGWRRSFLASPLRHSLPFQGTSAFVLGFSVTALIAVSRHLRSMQCNIISGCIRMAPPRHFGIRSWLRRYGTHAVSSQFGILLGFASQGTSAFDLGFAVTALTPFQVNSAFFLASPFQGTCAACNAMATRAPWASRCMRYRERSEA